ncbi:hypothetical protein FEM48_Zijuj01G0235500 [Ziziphus jujuba var. spinosa]|uniref:Uncharacterized protein n=1 Tax=Ziziphus jujuba var. spinosa TaxID=714518 RepID=A0A978W475_ZIZJJ|nr:hypothetical protein FEM48_Zijuj01G0235500 [Ziziphus jujuba var. spinosa]
MKLIELLIIVVIVFTDLVLMSIAVYPDEQAKYANCEEEKKNPRTKLLQAKSERNANSIRFAAMGNASTPHSTGGIAEDATMAASMAAFVLWAPAIWLG